MNYYRIAVVVLAAALILSLATRNSSHPEAVPTADGSKLSDVHGDMPVDCYDAQGNLEPDGGVAFGGFTTGCAPGQVTKPKTERVKVDKARLAWVQRVESCQKAVVDSGSATKDPVEVYRRKIDGCKDAPPGARPLAQLLDTVSADHDAVTHTVVCRGDVEIRVEQNGKYRATWTDKDGAMNESHGLARAQVITLPKDDIPTACD